MIYILKGKDVFLNGHEAFVSVKGPVRGYTPYVSNAIKYDSYESALADAKADETPIKL